MASLHPMHPAYKFIGVAEDENEDLKERFSSLLYAIEALCLTDSTPNRIHPLWHELSTAVCSSGETNSEYAKRLSIEAIGRMLWHRRPFNNDELTADYKKIEISNLQPKVNDLAITEIRTDSDLSHQPSTIYSSHAVSPEDLRNYASQIEIENRIMRARDHWVQNLPYGKFVLAESFGLIFETAELEGMNAAREIESLLDDLSGDQPVLSDYIGNEWLAFIREMRLFLQVSVGIDKAEAAALAFLVDGRIEKENHLAYFSLLAASLPSALTRHGYFAALSRLVFTPALDSLLPEESVDVDRSIAIDLYNIFSPLIAENDSLLSVRDWLVSDFSSGQFDIPEEWKARSQSVHRPDLINIYRTMSSDTKLQLSTSVPIASCGYKKYLDRLALSTLKVKIGIEGNSALDGRSAYVFCVACAGLLDHLQLLCGESSQRFSDYEILAPLFGSTPLEDKDFVFDNLIEAAFLSHKNYCDEHLAGASDISLFDLSDLLHRFHIVRESDTDHLVTSSMSLGMVFSLLTDPRFTEVQYSWRNRLSVEMHRMHNPNDIHWEGWLRQRYLLDLVGVLRSRGLSVSADALLGYFLVSEVLVCGAKWFFVEESMSHLAWATVHGSGFSVTCAGFCVEELKRIDQAWLARRVREAAQPPDIGYSALAALVDDRAALYRYDPAEEAKRVLGDSTLEELCEDGKDRVESVFTEVQALITAGSVYTKKDFGGAVMVFFRYFEDVLRDECNEAFLAAAVVPRSGIQKPKGQPTFGNYIRLINRVYSGSGSKELRSALKPTQGFFKFYPTIQRIADFGGLRNAAAHGSPINGAEYWQFHDCLIHDGYFKGFVLGCKGLFSAKDSR